MSEPWGVVTFFSSQHAIQAEKAAKQAGYSVELIPGPKDISPNCGVALRCACGDLPALEVLLKARFVKYEACHIYGPPAAKSLIDRLLGG